jgi:WD repeat-containing protein 42A
VHKLSIEPGSSHVFISCSGDGTARQFDLRQKEKHDIVADLSHAKSGGVRRTCIELNSVDFNPVNPNYFIIGGNDPYIRLYDRRMPFSSMGTGSSNIADTALACVQKYSPKHVIEKYKPERFYSSTHITGVRYNIYGTEIIATYSGDDVYMFDVQGGATAVPEKKKEQKQGSEDEMTDDDEEEHIAIVGEKLDYVCEFKQRFKGHVNVRTVKEVQFLGPHSEYVVSGSDCGHIFMWEASTGRLVNIVKGDKHVVNCIDPHPSCNLIFASCGIESDCKLWLPTKDEDNISKESDWEDIIHNNTSGSASRAFVVSPNLLLHYLLRGGLVGDSDDDDDDDTEEEEQPRQRRRVEGGEGVDTQRRLAAAVTQLLTNSDWADDDEGEESEDQEGVQEEGDQQEGRRPDCHMM